MENNKKYFFITIDTEEDNQWDVNSGVSTENAKYLQRFQELAEKYNYKPVWLTTYEMCKNDFFVEYFKQKQDKGLCEIGMHLHAWNNPPDYTLNSINNEKSYLIEYPKSIMEEKIKNLDMLLTEKFGVKSVSHRAGRWAMNDEYFELLDKYGYNIDCSTTPHVNWSSKLGSTGVKGTNYKQNSENIHFTFNNILEIPVTIRKIRFFEVSNIKKVKDLIKEIIFFIVGKNQWIRPSKFLSINGMKKVIFDCSKKNEYIMFMIHSSELMPNGSPNFKTKESIEKLYEVIEEIFDSVSNLGYEGITLREYYNKYSESLKKRL